MVSLCLHFHIHSQHGIAGSAFRLVWAHAHHQVSCNDLQSALGELAYESEAAERLRAELRASQRSLEDLQGELAAAKVRVSRAWQGSA